MYNIIFILSKSLPPIKKLKLFMGFILIGYLLFMIGPTSILDVLTKINLSLVLIVEVLLMIVFLLGATNVWLLLNPVSKIPFSSFIQSYMYSWSIGLITPGQIGDASITLLLKRKGIQIRYSSVAYFLDKCISLGILFFICWYGFCYFIPGYDNTWLLGLPFIVFLLIIFSNLLKKIQFNNLLLNQFKKWLTTCNNDLRSYNDHPFSIIMNIIITAIKWFLISYIYYLAFCSFDTKIYWPEVGIIPLLSTVVGYLPISVAGIGTVEVTAVYLFGLIGVAKATVLSVYIVLRTSQYLMAIVFWIVLSIIDEHKLIAMTKK